MERLDEDRVDAFIDDVHNEIATMTAIGLVFVSVRNADDDRLRSSVIVDAPRDAIAHAIRSLLALLVGTIDEETECEHCRALRARATTAIAAFGGAQEVDDDPLADVRGHG